MRGVRGVRGINRVPRPSRAGRAAKLWRERPGVLKAAQAAGVSLPLPRTPYFSTPRRTTLPLGSTIHDVIPLLYPEYAGTTATRLYPRLASAAARRVRRVIPDPTCSKRDVQRCPRIPAERVDVVPLAGDERCRPLPRRRPAPPGSASR